MYTTVIVPLDGSKLAEQALTPAAEVARTTGATLVPLMVLHDEASERHRSYVDDKVAGLGVPVQPPYLIQAADAAECIANAGEAPASLVVMTTHGSSGLRRVVLGSVAEKALRMLGRPMLMVGPGYEPGNPIGGGKLLLPIDGSEPAEAVVPVAAGWAREFDLHPCVVMVRDPDDDGAAAEATGHGDVVEEAAARRVAIGLGDLGVPAEWEVLHGAHAAGPIATFARGLPASLIAMTTHGRTGLARVAIGSTAAQALHEAPCPVLLMRPADLRED